MNRIRGFFALFLMLGLLICLAMSIEPASAIIPEMREIKPYTVGPNTWLNITIYHYPEDPSTITTTGDPGHFVDTLQVTVNGNSTLQSIGPVINSPPTEIFNWQFNLGVLPSTSTVTVTAHCSIDGWGPESAAVSASPSIIPAPEFPVISALIVIMLAITLLLFMAKKPFKNRINLRAI